MQGVLVRVVRAVTVNCGRTPQEVLDATGRTQMVNPHIVVEMPMGTEGRKEVNFFHVGCLSDTGLEMEFISRGFEPIDPCTLAAVNEADPTFADKYPNITHWQDAGGKWCYAFFHKSEMQRRSVFVCLSDGSYKDVWAAGVLPDAAVPSCVKLF